MADGIDRKADERMEFTTSKEVVVSPTFQDMHLKGKDCRMISNGPG
jgi:ATP-dependent RNA helicase